MLQLSDHSLPSILVICLSNLMKKYGFSFDSSGNAAQTIQRMAI